MAAITATVPLLALIGLGCLARAGGLLRPGDERALNGYLYWLALPALFLHDLSQAPLTPETLRFMAVGVLPVLAVGTLMLLLPGVPRDVRYLLAVTTLFGSLAFFGLPFVEFALGGGEPLRLASLAIAGTAPLTVGLTLFLLEAHHARGAPLWPAVQTILARLARNPLLLSLLLGVGLSLLKLPLPPVLAAPLAMLARTAAPLALITLGAFLYGGDYRSPLLALGLSLSRLILLPPLTFLAARVAGLPFPEQAVLVIMNGTPIAVNMLVLSERYKFHSERIAPLILISSLGALVSLNLWLLLLRSSLGR